VEKERAERKPGCGRSQGQDILSVQQSGVLSMLAGMKQFACLVLMAIIATLPIFGSFTLRAENPRDLLGPPKLFLSEAMRTVDEYLGRQHQSEVGKFLSLAEYQIPQMYPINSGQYRAPGNLEVAAPFGKNPYWEITYEELEPSTEGADHFYVSMDKEVKLDHSPNLTARNPSKPGTRKPSILEVLALAKNFTTHQAWDWTDWYVRGVYFCTPKGEAPHWYVRYAFKTAEPIGPPGLSIGMDGSIKVIPGAE
jgi:hypothetical protein